MFFQGHVQLIGNLASKICSACTVTGQRMEKIASLVIEQIDFFWHERFLGHSLSEI